MVANHASHLDGLILQAALPLEKIHSFFPAAAQDYFFTHSLRRLLATVALNAIPFGRRVGFRHSLRICQQLLATEGNSLLLFPEGTRSVDGSVAAFRPGIGLLLAGTRFPVVPCYLHDAWRAWPKGARLPRPRDVELRIGAPRYYTSRDSSRQSILDICSDLRAAVESLSGRGQPLTPPAARIQGASA